MCCLNYESSSPNPGRFQPQVRHGCPEYNRLEMGLLSGSGHVGACQRLSLSAMETRCPPRSGTQKSNSRQQDQVKDTKKKRHFTDGVETDPSSVNLYWMPDMYQKISSLGIQWLRKTCSPQMASKYSHK